MSEPAPWGSFFLCPVISYHYFWVYWEDGRGKGVMEAEQFERRISDKNLGMWKTIRQRNAVIVYNKLRKDTKSVKILAKCID